MKRYWHELSEEEQQVAIARKALCSEFEQPDWCNYPNSLRPGLGCWSLVDIDNKHIYSIEDCQKNGKCEFIKEKK